MVAAYPLLAGSGGCDLDEPFELIANEPPPDSLDLGPPQRVFAKRFVSPIRSAPSPEAERVGYMRAGALLHSTTSKPLGYEGCEGGWYELDTGGFACNTRDIIVFSGERLPELRARQADRSAVMPYEYVTVGRNTPVYKRIPRAEEIYEIPLEAVDVSADSAGGEASEARDSVDNPLVVRVLQPGFYVSLDRSFERDGVTYWRTQQNGFIPADHLRHKKWSEFKGQELSVGDWGLPVAVTRSERTTVYRMNERGKLRATRARLDKRSWIQLRSRRRIGDDAFWALRDGTLVRETDVLLIQPSAPPEGVGEGERWIDVDLGHQVLVAYDGTRPRYVTLVSTGRSKSPSPELDYRTPVGLHRIRGKHLTSTMDNDEPGAPPYSLEDVPYVMYFKGAYAFHSAFWHDRFGRPRSHGCVNLAPRDAKWLFNWAGPDLPESWHGGSATEHNPGTWVYVHGDTP
jgi:hypothetical protein